MQTLKLFTKDETGALTLLDLNLPILRMTMTQARGARPVLRLVIRWNDRPLLTGLREQIIVFQIRDQCFFTGKLESDLVAIDTYCLAAVFQGEGPNFLAQTEHIKKAEKIDPLFYTPSQLENLDFILRDIGMTWWQSTDQEIDWMDALTGVGHVRLSSEIAAEGFKLEKMHEPVPAVHARIEANWIQEGWGNANIGEKIARLWPEGVLKTLAGPDLIHRWIQAKKVRHSSYDILESRLESGGELNQMIALTAEKRILQQAFKPHVVVDWTCQLPRKEVCHFEMKAPGVSTEFQTPYHLDIDLQDITLDRETPIWIPHQRYQKGDYVMYQSTRYHCTADHVARPFFWRDKDCWQSCSTTAAPLGQISWGQYFTTERGQKSLAYAVRLAEARLKKFWLCQRLQFRVSLDVGKTLTPQNILTVKDRRLPDGTLTGVIQEVSWVLDGEQKTYHVLVTAFCPMGPCRVHPVPTKEHHFTLWPHDLGGKAQFQEGDEKERDFTIGPDQLVQGVRVKHDAAEQLREVGDELAAAPRKKWRQILKKVPTEVEVDLADLVRVEPLERHYEITFQL